MGVFKLLTYHNSLEEPPPCRGQYLVFLGKTGILSVNLIQDVRRIEPKVVRNHNRYRLMLSPQTDALKDYTVFERTYNSANVWVKGVQALPCFWISKGSQLKRRP